MDTQIKNTQIAHRCGRCDACYIGGTRTQCPHHVCHECWETVAEYFEADGEGRWTRETSTCTECKAAIASERAVA